MQIFADRCDRSIIAIGAQQRLIIAAQNLFGGKAGDLPKRRISIFDGTFLISMVDDQDAIDTRFDRKAAQSQRLLRQTSRREVTTMSPTSRCTLQTRWSQLQGDDTATAIIGARFLSNSPAVARKRRSRNQNDGFGSASA
jgi:hypothetical protein